MTPTILFQDVGSALLTNGWDHLACRPAAKSFNLQWSEIEERHSLNFETHEEGKLSFEDYPDRMAFYRRRPFTESQFKRSIFEQSQPIPGMIEIFAQLKTRHGLKIAVVSNESREANAYRIRRFKLDELVDSFVSSCFIQCASLIRTSSGCRLASPRRQPGRYCTSRMRRSSSSSRKLWGFAASFTRIISPPAPNWLLSGFRRRAFVKPTNPSILTINGGSSGIKLALYQAGEPLKRTPHGTIDCIGLSGTNLTFDDPATNYRDRREPTVSDHRWAGNYLMDWLEKQEVFGSPVAVGHRVAQAMQHSAPKLVTQELLDELRRISPRDPDHLSSEIELIELNRKRHPKPPKVTSCDTAFHRGMPRAVKMRPIPRSCEAMGVQRYEFHGGLNTLVFAGGIAENTPSVRARICERLGFLAIELTESRNAENAGVISTDQPGHYLK
jgi:hypothetical protein